MTTPADPRPTPPVGRTGTSRWLIAGGAAIIGALVLLNGVTLWMLFDDDAPQPASTVTEDTAQPADDAWMSEGEVVTLESMTSTVGGPGVRHARTKMALVLGDGIEAEQVLPRVPLLEDALLLELAEMSGDQLHRPEGARALRDRMTAHAHDIWGDDVVRRVVFTELVIP